LSAKTEGSSDSRERVQQALSHKVPDRVPIDFGSTVLTGIHASVVAALRKHYGLENRPPVITDPFTMVALVDDDLRDVMGIDTVGAFPLSNLYGFPNQDYKSYVLNGLEVLVPGLFNTTVDAGGNTLLYPGGNVNAKPSGRMHRGGFFFDHIVRQRDIDEESLNPEDNLEEYQPITELELDHLRAQSQVAAQGGRCVVMTLPGTSFGCSSQLPGPGLEDPRGIRDFAEWMVSTKLRKDYIHAVFSAQAEIILANLAKIRGAVKGAVDVVLVDTNDFGAQGRPLFSAATYRELFMPYHKQINSWIHQNTRWATMKHSCGFSEPFLEPFVEAGFDIFNPVQCSAGMEPAHLKSQYGDRVVFWGGGAEAQTLLSARSPANVRAEVLERCAVFSQGGGFVFGCTHNIQPLTPVENVVAMVDAIQDFSDRRL
jgi:hypothetical protein